MKAYKWLVVIVCSFSVVIELVAAIVSKIDGQNDNDNYSNNETDNVHQVKSDRKGDLVAQTSYEHPHYYGGGDYGGYGGGHGGGGGGGHYDHHHHHVEHHGDDSFKYLLVPLAGVALLGAAALFATNPILLQLGVISGRKRRNVPDENQYSLEVLEKLNKLHLLERFIEQFPRDQIKRQEKKLLANYLHCSANVENKNNMCLERLTCEIENPFAKASKLEKEVFKIIKKDIMENELITDGLKRRLEEAKKLGSEEGDCRKYFCSEVDLSRYAQ